MDTASSVLDRQNATTPSSIISATTTNTQSTSPGVSESSNTARPESSSISSAHSNRQAQPPPLLPSQSSDASVPLHGSSKSSQANGSFDSSSASGPSKVHNHYHHHHNHHHTVTSKPSRSGLVLDPITIPSASTSTSSSTSRPHPHIAIDDSSYPLRSPTLFSPVSTPPESSDGSGIHRRRSSNPPSPGSALARLRRKPSSEQPRSATTPVQRSRTDEHGFSWFTSNLLTLPPVEVKHNKSDDERESEPHEVRRAAKAKKKRQWFGMDLVPEGSTMGGLEPPPAISMTPPPAGAEPFMDAPLLVPTPTNLSPPRPTTYTVPSPLAPLPQDPNNILPLSLPPSPIPSPPASIHPTPYHSPHPSIPDLSTAFASGPSGSSGSPRTSISTSSSRAWQQSGSGGRSDSRSSAEDEDSPTFPSYAPHAGHSRSWWFNAADALPVSPKISTSSQARTLRPKFVPTGTRSWGWLLELVGPITRKDGQTLRTNARQRQRNRERERLMAGQGGRTLRGQAWLGNKWLGRVMAFVPTNPWSVVLTLTFCGFLIFLITLTIKHILNPDKEPLPWRRYCTSEYPSLYSLQEPQINKYNFNTYDQANFASSLNMFLSPLDSTSPAWPYGSHSRPPYSAEAATTSDIDELEPVGVLVGVFTTDAGADRRHMIRQSYASHWRSRTEGTEGVRVRFVMGQPRAKYAKAIELEMEAFNDILLLDMPENMNSGKTYAFFSWAAQNATVPYWEYPSRLSSEQDNDVRSPAVWKGERKPQYVVKADDDSFIMLGELERRLRAAPRNKAYWGYLVKNLFMAGECYGLSFDLVQYIAESPALRTLTRGKEDKLVSKWMRLHPEREQIVWVAQRCWIYDHPKAGTVYSHGFLYPSTVAEVRAENRTGLSSSALAVRGGPEAADSYSTVSKWGTAYRPLSNSMSAVEEIEALVEGSAISQLRDQHLLDSSSSSSPSGSQTFSHVEPISQKITKLYSSRPTRNERFLGDPRERGGTVVVHYIKKPEWFVETMVALLGSADEQGGWHYGIGNGLGMFERTEGRVAHGQGDGGHTGVKVGKGSGL
ncbi:hypothetical protein BCR39DRAFT_544488 [Naematelia encephala]|uniref:Galactosyltransferase-domain-containing protein n=1 Tax=Naematelia encephala TaxID=71784 RepID=A0A1Y2AS21_9TREE|nr:hypothetical protein BCR39DRAFT_544488 [Naematelia encephala]